MAALQELIVEADAFRVANDAVLLTAELHNALVVTLHDDTQGAGGLLHLRYLATGAGRTLDLTDNTLSSDLLLMDRFCKELRALGARKHSWRISVLSHIPALTEIERPAATVIDLITAYFADSRRPVERRNFATTAGVRIKMHAREGRLWVADLAPAHVACAAAL